MGRCAVSRSSDVPVDLSPLTISRTLASLGLDQVRGAFTSN